MKYQIGDHDDTSRDLLWCIGEKTFNFFTNMSDSNKERLDKALVTHGLTETRSRARDLIKRGCVLLDGKTVDKPATLVSETANLSLIGEDTHYVSRGALKLLKALDYFSQDINKSIALDLGASTGGFTEVLIERGVKKVYAVDVGQGQLHNRLLENPQVISLENQDARLLTKELIYDPIDLIVSDLSFISLTKALLPALRFANNNAFLITLVKPQFEVEKKAIGKGGIVRDENIRLEAVKRVVDWVNKQQGWSVIGTTMSPITGQGGNQEYLLGAKYND